MTERRMAVPAADPTALQPERRLVRARLEALLATGVAPKIAAWLLSFGFVFVLAADSGGYWPTTWGWSTLVLSLVGGLVLVLRAEIRFGVLEKAAGLALLAFIAWGLLSALWSPSAAEPLLQSQRLLVYAAALLAALLLARSRSYYALLAGTWCAIALICIYSLLTRLVPDRLGFVDTLAGYRLEQPLGYWNSLGVFATVGTVLALGFAARSGHATVRALAAASTVPLVSTLYFTFSRGSWISLGLGLLVTLALDRRRLQLFTLLLVVGPWPALAVWHASGSEPLTRIGTGLAAAAHAGHRFLLVEVGLSAAAATAVLVFTVVERRAPVARRLRLAYAAVIVLVIAGALAAGVVRFGSPATVARHLYDGFVGPGVTIQHGNLNRRLFDLSGGPRIPQWKVAWREYKAHPGLGSGLGTYERYWNQLRPTNGKVVNAHNLYLETLAELGPAGLALLVLVLAMPLVAFLKARRRSLAAAAAGAYAAYLVHVAVDWDWQIPAVTLAALFCGAALLAAARTGHESRLQWRLPVLGLILVVAAFAFVGLRGNRAVAASEAAANGGNLPAAIDHARTAARWAPWSARPWQLLGEAESRQNRLGAARADLRKAAKKDPDDWSIWLDLALASTGRERRHALAEAFRLNPLDPVVASFRGS
jgi:cytochrome c-type biogenesis protein CcmH/NrfG